MQNFIILGLPLLGEKYVAQKERKKKNNIKYSGHFVPQQRPRAVHALRSDQNNAINSGHNVGLAAGQRTHSYLINDIALNVSTAVLRTEVISAHADGVLAPGSQKSYPKCSESLNDF